MEKITYGAPRLVDWVAQIKAGAATVRVHFTGGALTSYGVTPAEYTTASPFIQKVVEQSSYFKEGRIIVLRRAMLSGPAAVPAKVQKTKQKQESKAGAQMPMAGPAAQSAPLPADETVSGTAVTEEAAPKDVAGTAGEADGGLTKVEVSCLQDAQAYLQEHYQISSYKVRSYEAAQLAASEHGVEFTGAKFAPAGGEASESAGEEE